MTHVGSAVAERSVRSIRNHRSEVTLRRPHLRIVAAVVVCLISAADWARRRSSPSRAGSRGTRSTSSSQARIMSSNSGRPGAGRAASALLTSPSWPTRTRSRAYGSSASTSGSGTRAWSSRLLTDIGSHVRGGSWARVGRPTPNRTFDQRKDRMIRADRAAIELFIACVFAAGIDLHGRLAAFDPQRHLRVNCDNCIIQNVRVSAPA